MKRHVLLGLLMACLLAMFALTASAQEGSGSGTDSGSGSATASSSSGSDDSGSGSDSNSGSGSDASGSGSAGSGSAGNGTDSNSGSGSDASGSGSAGNGTETGSGSGSGSSSSSGSDSGNDPENLNFGSFKMKVNGNNVPKYTVSLANTSASFTFALKNLFEVTPEKDDDDDYDLVGGSNVQLTSLKWLMTDVTEDDDNYYFTITGSKKGGNTQFASLSFANTIPKTNTSFVKIDVIISNYTFVSSASNAKLALAYKFDTPVQNASKSDLSDYNVKLKDKSSGQVAYLNFTNTALLQETNKWVAVNLVFEDDAMDSDDNLLWVLYDRWNGTQTLVQDPQAGFEKDNSNDDDDGGSKKWIIAVVIIGVIVVLGVIGFFLHRRRKARYENMA